MSVAVVLGDVMLDVVVRPRGSFAPASDTPASIKASRGGAGANLAIALRASGHHVRYVGAAGQDAGGDVFAASLRQADVTALLEIVDAPTGTVVALVSSDGQRSMLTDRGANSRLSVPFVEACLADPYDHLHVSGYLLLDLATRPAALRALRLADEQGRTTSVDVCSVSPLREITPEVFLEVASFAAWLFANEEEALVLTGAHDVDGALDVLETSFDEAVVTLGEHGARAARGHERFDAPAREVRVLDTTGAGDAATGTYLGARLRGEAPGPALEVAMEAAARVVAGLGALG